MATKKEKASKNETDSNDNIQVESNENKNIKSMSAYCDDIAYGIVYNKEFKRYDIVTVKYSLETKDAFVEKIEAGSDHAVLAMEELNKRFELTDVKHKRR